MTTPEEIYKAARIGDWGMIERAFSGLEEQDRSPLISGTFGQHGDETPLHAAAFHQRVNAIRVLTEAGADPNAKNRNGNTPLHWVVFDRRCPGYMHVKLLLEAGADPNAKNNHGVTPFHWAAMNATVEIVELMWENGANMRVVDRSGETCLHRASKNKNDAAVAEFLLARGAGAYLNATENYGQTPLHHACFADGNLDIVRRFLAHDGIDVQAKDRDGCTPLHIAAIEAVLLVIRLLVDKSADLEATDIHGSTPLHYASKHSYLRGVRLLVELGANMYAKNDSEKTPLDEAVDAHHADDIVDYLLQRYPEVIIEQEGDLCLHSVLREVRYVKDGDNQDADNQGGDKRGGDNQGGDNQGGDDNMVDDHDVMALLPIGTLTMDQMISLLKQSVAHRPNCTRATNANGELALHIACCRPVCPVQVVRFLVGQYSDSVRMQDNNGATPLHIACRSPHASKEVLRFLVEEGDAKTLAVRDGHGALPLHVLCASDPGVEVVKYIVQQHSQALNKKTVRGDLPIMVACEQSSSLSVVYALMRAHPSALINSQKTE